MAEYQLAFCTMPQLLFAHRFSTRHYDLTFMPSEDQACVEITHVRHGDCQICFLDTEEKIDVPENSMIVSLFERPRRIVSVTYHEHITFGFQAAYTHVENGGLRLPQVLSFGEEENPLLPSMEQLVLQSAIDAGAPQSMGLVYSILGQLSTLYLSNQQKKQYVGQELYIKRAQKCIVDNIALPLRVTDIADSLGISTGYLSHLFHQYLGQTVVEYINTVRIRRVEELVLNYGMDIRQAGAQVGLSDPNYVSRLFQKIRGCSLTELRHTRFQHPMRPEEKPKG